VGNEGRVILWNEQGVATHSFEVRVSGSGDSCTGIVSSRIDFAARTMEIRAERALRVWSFLGQVVRRVPLLVTSDKGRSDAEAETISSDGNYVVRTAADRTREIAERDGRVLLRLRRQRSPAFSHRSGRLATVADDVDDRVIHLWDLFAPPATPPDAASVHAAIPLSKAIRLGTRDVTMGFTAVFDRFMGVLSPDGRTAAVVTDNYGQVALWRLPSGAADGSARTEVEQILAFETDQLASADFDSALSSLSFSPDSRSLATGGTDGTVKVWGLDGKPTLTFAAHYLYAHARFSPDGLLILTWGDAREGEVSVKLWSTDGELLDSLSTESVSDAWFSPDGHWVLASRESQDVLVWSLDLDYLIRTGCTSLRHHLANPKTVTDRDLCG
jgi:hypothetical protein